MLTINELCLAEGTLGVSCLQRSKNDITCKLQELNFEQQTIFLTTLEFKIVLLKMRLTLVN